jgi:hypothetical protein
MLLSMPNLSGKANLNTLRSVKTASTSSQKKDASRNNSITTQPSKSQSIKQSTESNVPSLSSKQHDTLNTFTNSPMPVTKKARSIASTASTASRIASHGRGGVGNMHLFVAEQQIFSFDEELEKQKEMVARMAPVYHAVGRGGAGNWIS